MNAERGTRNAEQNTAVLDMAPVPPTDSPAPCSPVPRSAFRIPRLKDPLACLDNQNGQLIAALNKIFSKQETFEKVNAKLNQRKIAREFGDNRKSMNGLGRVRLEVDSYAFHYWGQRIGYKCWKDPQFLREFERDNPDARVKCQGTRFQVGHSHQVVAAPREGFKRFVKKYPGEHTRLACSVSAPSPNTSENTFQSHEALGEGAQRDTRGACAPHQSINPSIHSSGGNQGLAELVLPVIFNFAFLILH